MNILIFIWRDMQHPQAGGSELIFHEVSKRWVKQGHRVTWLTSSFKGALPRESNEGMEIIRTGNRFTLYLNAAWLYLTKLRKQFDVLIDVENGIPFFTPLYSRKKRILHIHHVHKDVWAREIPFPFSFIGKFLEMHLMPLVYRGIPVTTLSKSSAEEILREKLTKEKPIIINPAIEFLPYKKYPRNKIPTVLFMNRIKKYKGGKVLLQAVKELRKNNFTHFTVLFGGDGDDLGELKTYAKQHALTNVTFLGDIRGERKTKALQQSWVFVNPSFKEGWGIVNIEANYFGLPVLGSNVDGIRDSVKDGKTGYLFKYGDYKALAERIRFLLTHKKTLATLSKEAKQWASTFTWDANAKAYLKALYHALKR